MSLVNKKTMRYTIINGNFNKTRNITDETLALILTANAVVFDEYVNIDFLNEYSDQRVPPIPTQRVPVKRT